MTKIPHLRWLIAFALFLAAVLNYLDRSILGLLAPTIQKDLGINDDQYASVINWFLVAYTVAYLFSGRIVDRFGVKISFALFVGWWSISNALTGLAQGVKSLSGFRFMLGLGEAGSWTASPKAVSEWFPPSERGMAVGIYSLGGAAGATIAPILVSVIAMHYGWRAVFLISPILAGLWLIFWLWLYKKPSEHPRITDDERKYLLENMEPASPPSTESESTIWGHVIREPLVWQLMIARLLTDPVWYFYQFWMPKYLHTVRHLEQKELSMMWMIFLAADIGFLAGGFFAGRLIKKGVLPPASRIWIMTIAACCVPLSALIPGTASVSRVIYIGMAICCALTAWLGCLTSLVVDIVPKKILGTAFGLIACGSALGGILMNKGVAWMANSHSYDQCFFIMAVAHPVALVLLWSLRKKSCST